MTERLHFHFSLSCIGERNGNPLQCSCLENPRDGDAWWAAVYGVAHSRTRLKWLSSSSMIDVLCQNGKKKNRKQCFQLLLDLIGNFIGNDCPFIVYKGLSFEKRSYKLQCLVGSRCLGNCPCVCYHCWNKGKVCITIDVKLSGCSQQCLAWSSEA